MRLRLLPGAVAAVLLLMPEVASAKKDLPDPPNTKRITFPDKDPVLSISILDSWTAVTGPNLVVITPKVGVGKVTLIMKDKVTDPQAELKKALEELEERGVKWESRGEEHAFNGMKGFSAKGIFTLKNGGTGFISQVIFSPDGKHYFDFSANYKEKDDESIGPALQFIGESIKPLTAPAKEIVAPNPSSLEGEYIDERDGTSLVVTKDHWHVRGKEMEEDDLYTAKKTGNSTYDIVYTFTIPSMKGQTMTATARIEGNFLFVKQEGSTIEAKWKRK